MITSELELHEFERALLIKGYSTGVSPQQLLTYLSDYDEKMFGFKILRTLKFTVELYLNSECEPIYLRYKCNDDTQNQFFTFESTTAMNDALSFGEKFPEHSDSSNELNQVVFMMTIGYYIYNEYKRIVNQLFTEENAEISDYNMYTCKLFDNLRCDHICCCVDDLLTSDIVEMFVGDHGGKELPDDKLTDEYCECVRNSHLSFGDYITTNYIENMSKFELDKLYDYYGIACSSQYKNMIEFGSKLSLFKECFGEVTD